MNRMAYEVPRPRAIQELRDIVERTTWKSEPERYRLRALAKFEPDEITEIAISKKRLLNNSESGLL